MSARGVHRFSHELDEAAIQNLFTRMEFRGKDPHFSKDAGRKY